MPTLTPERDLEHARSPQPHAEVRLPPPARPRARRMWFVLAALFVAASLAVAVLLPNQVTVVHPAAMSLRDDAVGTGFVKAKVLVGVGAKINGVIVVTHVDQGDQVRAGQVLAELQNTDVQGQLRQASHQLTAQHASAATAQANVIAARARLQASVSTLEKARAALHFADVTLERARSLSEDGIVSKDAFDDADTARAEAAHDVATADALRVASAQAVAAAESDAAAAATLADVSAAGIDVQRANLAYTVVRSPVNGYVVTRDLEPGATVVPGLPIFTVADSSVIWVSANIDEREVGGLRVGQPATVTVRSDPTRKIPGVVARIGQQADPVTEEVTVDVAFAKGSAGVRLNETAEVEIVKRDKSVASAVPATALVRAPRGSAVWMVRSGRLTMQPVQTGIQDKRGWIEITSGVTGSDVVLMNPSIEVTALSSGMRVRTHVSGAR